MKHIRRNANIYLNIVYPDGTCSDGEFGHVPVVGEELVLSKKVYKVVEVKEVPPGEDNKDPDGNRLVDYEVRLAGPPRF